MKKSTSNPAVDFYFEKAQKWQDAVKKLRQVVLCCGLAEELKWGVPCYSLNTAKVVLIHDFKNYCALLFFKGALLKDPNNILIQQTKNVQAARQIRFTNAGETVAMQAVLKAYILQAIEIEKAGLKVQLKETAEFNIAEEFEQHLLQNAALGKAFYALTPGRQKGYLLYFAAAKLSKTRLLRVEKSIPAIVAGKGLTY